MCEYINEASAEHEFIKGDEQSQGKLSKRNLPDRKNFNFFKALLNV